jgi:hypothetical protein
MAGADHLAQILGIEPGRERGRADKVAEHHREPTALGAGTGGRKADPPSLAPHSAQNLAPGRLAPPHDGHRTGTGAPRSSQNLPPSRSSARQPGHSMPHLNLWRRSAYHRSRRYSSRSGDAGRGDRTAFGLGLAAARPSRGHSVRPPVCRAVGAAAMSHDGSMTRPSEPCSSARAQPRHRYGSPAGAGRAPLGARPCRAGSPSPSLR